MRTAKHFVVTVAAVMLIAGTALAQVCNLKVVTDASPDYTDMDSLIHSITSKWPTPAEKVWAVFYWHHINRRQMSPMYVHGMELADPIRQWNDYGYTMCSTVTGINCSVFGAMGYPVRHWEIQSHTVPEVFYDGRWHMIDSSMSALYTLCDGKTIAGTEDIGKTQGCTASGGKEEFGHIAQYHCLNGTGVKGLLTGADCNRELYQEALCFNPNKIHNCNDLWWDRGHRYILNLREGEVYTRTYHRLGDDVAYYTPNPHRKNADPDYRPDYKIRGNGVRTFTPELTAAGLLKTVHTTTGTTAAPGLGVYPLVPGQPGEVVFKVEGANVITSMTILADVFRKTAADSARILIAPAATPQPDRFTEVWKSDATGDQHTEVTLTDKVNGGYEFLVKVELTGKPAPTDARLKHISFKTITQVNAKALPRLNIGRNTIYVGRGDPTESVVLWPELQDGRYKSCLVEERNVVSEKEHPQVCAVLHPAKPNEDAWVTFRLDAPRDIVRLTYGGRLWNKASGSQIDFLHSFDGGKTWTKSYTLGPSDFSGVPDAPNRDPKQRPFDVIHYETVSQVPPGMKSVLFRYAMRGRDASAKGCGLVAVRMEANYRPADPTFKPIEATFTWQERQEDYSLVERSHTQLVLAVPFRYVVNVGGVDHPQMESLRVNVKGAAGELKYGYSDGKDVGGKKFVSFKAIYGRNFAEGKSYTCSIPSADSWDAGDKNGSRKLTDGIAWCAYGGGAAYSHGLLWNGPKDVTITVDLEKPEKLGGFRVHVHGYPYPDAMRGGMPDKIEVLTSVDDKAYASRGFFNLKMRWKDLPADFMWPDSEQLQGHMFDLVLPARVEARYVRFKVASTRMVGITEVQALDAIKREPFDLRIALPNEKPVR